MLKCIVNIIIFTSLTVNIFAQDTINFKPFDSLNTSSVDNNGVGKDTIKLVSTKQKLKRDPSSFDVRVFRKINNSRSEFADVVLPFFDVSAPPMAFIMPMSTMVYGRFSEKYYDENTGYLLGISQGLNIFLTFGTKMLVNRTRPCNALNDVHYNEGVGTDPYSFPSGHTSTAFATATMFNLRYPDYPQVYVPMYLYSLIVAYGRPYFGMHYPTDLLCGAIFGAGSSLLVYSLRGKLLRLKNRILSEDKLDEGSLNGGTLAIFGGAFIASSILGQLMLGNNNKVMIAVSPFGSSNESVNVNLKVNF